MPLSEDRKAAIARAFYAASERAMVDYYARDRRPWKAREHVWDSEIGGCLRKTVLSMIREPPPNPEETPGSIQSRVLGDMIHKRLQTMFAASASFVDAETSHDEPASHGRADLWLDLQGIGKSLVEIKTISLFGWQNLGASPKDDHLLQCHQYMRKNKLEWCLVAYYSPDADVNLLDPKVYVVDYDPDIAAQAKRWADDAVANAKKGRLPPIPEGFTANTFPCRSARKRDGVVFRCPWRDFCWPNVPIPDAGG